MIKNQSKKYIILFLGILFSFMIVMQVQSADWPQWRGLNRDGISKEIGLLKTWPENGPKLIWTATGFGSGFSSPSISNGNIYISQELKMIGNSFLPLTLMETLNGKQNTVKL
ncbi:MAG: hypothetical protein ACUVWN_16905 [bacterium]